MLQIYQELPYANLIYYDYYHLAGRWNSGVTPYAIPYIKDLIDNTWQTLKMAETDRAVQEALETYEFPVFNMTRQEFRASAHKNIHLLPMNLPNKADFQYDVYSFLRKQYLSFTEVDGSIMNSPIGGGVW